MTVEFLGKFSRDLDNLKQDQIRKSIARVILRVERARSLAEIPNLKKLSGFADAYRVRIGDHRIGLFITGQHVQFARVVHRKDIYRLFP